MKLNTWYRTDYSSRMKHFYRYYFTQLDSGDYFGIEYNSETKSVVAIDSWPGHDTQDEITMKEPIFNKEVYEKKIVDFAFLHGEIL